MASNLCTNTQVLHFDPDSSVKSRIWIGRCTRIVKAKAHEFFMEIRSRKCNMWGLRLRMWMRGCEDVGLRGYEGTGYVFHTWYDGGFIDSRQNAPTCHPSPKTSLFLASRINWLTETGKVFSSKSMPCLLTILRSFFISLLCFFLFLSSPSAQVPSGR